MEQVALLEEQLRLPHASHQRQAAYRLASVLSDHNVSDVVRTRAKDALMTALQHSKAYTDAAIVIAEAWLKDHVPKSAGTVTEAASAVIQMAAFVPSQRRCALAVLACRLDFSQQAKREGLATHPLMTFAQMDETAGLVVCRDACVRLSSILPPTDLWGYLRPFFIRALHSDSLSPAKRRIAVNVFIPVLRALAGLCISKQEPGLHRSLDDIHALMCETAIPLGIVQAGPDDPNSNALDDLLAAEVAGATAADIALIHLTQHGADHAALQLGVRSVVSLLCLGVLQNVYGNGANSTVAMVHRLLERLTLMDESFSKHCDNVAAASALLLATSERPHVFVNTVASVVERATLGAASLCFFPLCQMLMDVSRLPEDAAMRARSVLDCITAKARDAGNVGPASDKEKEDPALPPSVQALLALVAPQGKPSMDRVGDFFLPSRQSSAAQSSEDNAEDKAPVLWLIARRLAVSSQVLSGLLSRPLLVDDGKVTTSSSADYQQSSAQLLLAQVCESDPDFALGIVPCLLHAVNSSIDPSSAMRSMLMLQYCAVDKATASVVMAVAQSLLAVHTLQPVVCRLMAGLSLRYKWVDRQVCDTLCQQHAFGWSAAGQLARLESLSKLAAAALGTAQSMIAAVHSVLSRWKVLGPTIVAAAVRLLASLVEAEGVEPKSALQAIKSCGIDLANPDLDEAILAAACGCLKAVGTVAMDASPVEECPAESPEPLCDRDRTEVLTLLWRNAKHSSALVRRAARKALCAFHPAILYPTTMTVQTNDQDHADATFETFTTVPVHELEILLLDTEHAVISDTQQLVGRIVGHESGVASRASVARWQRSASRQAQQTLSTPLQTDVSDLFRSVAESDSNAFRRSTAALALAQCYVPQIDESLPPESKRRAQALLDDITYTVILTCNAVATRASLLQTASACFSMGRHLAAAVSELSSSDGSPTAAVSDAVLSHIQDQVLPYVDQSDSSAAAILFVLAASLGSLKHHTGIMSARARAASWFKDIVMRRSDVASLLPALSVDSTRCSVAAFLCLARLSEQDGPSSLGDDEPVSLTGILDMMGSDDSEPLFAVSCVLAAARLSMAQVRFGTASSDLGTETAVRLLSAFFVVHRSLDGSDCTEDIVDAMAEALCLALEFACELDQKVKAVESAGELLRVCTDTGSTWALALFSGCLPTLIRLGLVATGTVHQLLGKACEVVIHKQQRASAEDVAMIGKVWGNTWDLTKTLPSSLEDPLRQLAAAGLRGKVDSKQLPLLLYASAHALGRLTPEAAGRSEIITRSREIVAWLREPISSAQPSLARAASFFVLRLASCPLQQGSPSSSTPQDDPAAFPLLSSMISVAASPDAQFAQACAMHCLATLKHIPPKNYGFCLNAAINTVNAADVEFSRELVTAATMAMIHGSETSATIRSFTAEKLQPESFSMLPLAMKCGLLLHLTELAQTLGTATCQDLLSQIEGMATLYSASRSADSGLEEMLLAAALGLWRLAAMVLTKQQSTEAFHSMHQLKPKALSVAWAMLASKASLPTENQGATAGSFAKYFSDTAGPFPTMDLFDVAAAVVLMLETDIAANLRSHVEAQPKLLCVIARHAASYAVTAVSFPTVRTFTSCVLELIESTADLLVIGRLLAACLSQPRWTSLQAQSLLLAMIDQLAGSGGLDVFLALVNHLCSTAGNVSDAVAVWLVFSSMPFQLCGPAVFKFLSDAVTEASDELSKQAVLRGLFLLLKGSTQALKTKPEASQSLRVAWKSVQAGVQL